MTNILVKLRLGQHRSEALSDLIQDTLNLAEDTTLPPCNTADLARALDACQSIFYILGAVATRIERRHTDLHPSIVTPAPLKGA